MPMARGKRMPQGKHKGPYGFHHKALKSRLRGQDLNLRSSGYKLHAKHSPYREIQPIHRFALKYKIAETAKKFSLTRQISTLPAPVRQLYARLNAGLHFNQ